MRHCCPPLRLTPEPFGHGRRFSHRRDYRAALRRRRIRGFPFEPILETAALQSLFVALYVGPYTRLVAMSLFGAIADDVERAVVVLDVRVPVPHILIGVTVLERHDNCHGSNFQLRRQNADSDSSVMGPSLTNR